MIGIAIAVTVIAVCLPITIYSSILLVYYRDLSKIDREACLAAHQGWKDAIDNWKEAIREWEEALEMREDKNP